MFVFFIYAVVVWWLAARWRRTWRGFAVTIAGLLGIVLVGWFHLKLSEWTHGRIYVVVLQVLLYPYGALVFGLGMFMAVLPRAKSGVPCRTCGYDMTGLEPALADELMVVCPECGGSEAGWRAHSAVAQQTSSTSLATEASEPVATARPVGAWRELAHLSRSPDQAP